jgi:hypothetical protein
MYSPTPSDRCPRCLVLLNLAAANYCPWCGYPQGILANRTYTDDAPHSALGMPLPQQGSALVSRNVAYMAAPTRMTPILLLGLAGLSFLAVVGIVLATWSTLNTIAIMP